MQDIAEKTFRRIGRGFCGTVWSITGTESACAIKREDGGPGRSRHNDHVIYRRSHNGFIYHSARSLRTKVPPVYPYHRPNLVEQMDPKISPGIPNALRRAFIRSLTAIPQINTRDPHLNILSRIAGTIDQDCLIRPYLGLRHRLER